MLTSITIIPLVKYIPVYLADIKIGFHGDIPDILRKMNLFIRDKLNVERHSYIISPWIELFCDTGVFSRNNPSTSRPVVLTLSCHVSCLLGGLHRHQSF